MYQQARLKIRWSIRNFTKFSPLPLASVSRFRFSAPSVYGNGAQMMMGTVGLIEVALTSLCFLYFTVTWKNYTSFAKKTYRLKPSHARHDVETLLSRQCCKIDNTVTSLPVSATCVRICQEQRAVYLFLSDILHLSIEIRHLVRPLLSLRPASCDKTSTDSLLFA